MVDALLLKVVQWEFFIGDFPERFDPCLPSPEVGFDAVAKVATGKSAEADFSGEVILAGTINRDDVHGSKGTEYAESLADGAFAQV